MVEVNSEWMQNIVIVCEDNYGLDIYFIIKAINARIEEEAQRYKILGFLHDNPDSWAEFVPPVPIISNIDDWTCELETRYVIAIRDPERKRIAVEKLKVRGAVFETIIAPWVQHPVKFEHGEGCIIANYNFKYKSKFGNFVIMDTCMCETVEIGDYSTIGPFVNITTATIGKSVYIGAHAAVIPGRIIGDNVFICPGSIVMSNVKSEMCVGGIPASKNLNKWR